MWGANALPPTNSVIVDRASARGGAGDDGWYNCLHNFTISLSACTCTTLSSAVSFRTSFASSAESERTHQMSTLKLHPPAMASRFGALPPATSPCQRAAALPPARTLDRRRHPSACAHSCLSRAERNSSASVSYMQPRSDPLGPRATSACRTGRMPAVRCVAAAAREQLQSKKPSE